MLDKSIFFVCFAFFALLEVSAQKLIWSSPETGEIWQAELNGTNPQVFMDVDALTGTPGHEPRKLAYSTNNDRIYWTENSLGIAGIFSAKSDGTNVTTVVDIPTVFGAGEYFTEGITVAGNQIFWTDTAKKRIYAANLDGTNARILIDGTDGSINDATGITNDGTHLYWCDNGFEGIYKANLDGTGAVQIVDVVAETGDTFFGTWDIVFADGKLYWTGVFGPSVYSCDTSGTNVSAVLADTTTIGSNRPFGITEHGGKIYFGDSDGLSNAIYRVETNGLNAGLFVNGSTDDRYPLVIPTAEVVSPEITAFNYNSNTLAVGISFTGATATSYGVRTSTLLDFSNSANFSEVESGGNPIRVTTDGSGNGTFNFILSSDTARNFFQVFEAN